MVTRFTIHRFRKYLILGIWLVVIPLLIFLVADWRNPLPNPQRIQSVIVLAEDNTPLRAFADSQGVWRYPVRLEEVSPLYLEALLGYEDRWFYYHPGINPVSLLRAARQWFSNGRIISGGSTITMQLARILEPHSRSVRGKLRQMFRALQLEWHYSKDEILTFYLNLAPFGGPIEGVQTAAYAYLHKPVQNLTHAEAALLAVLPQAPSRLRPDRHPERAQRYRDKVLKRMNDLGIWPPEVLGEARMERVYQAGFRQPMLAPLFARRMKDSPVNQDLARIETSLDPEMQWSIESIVAGRLGNLPDQASAAVLVMENNSGLIRAYVGSAEFYSTKRAGQVDMVQAMRSPGSTLKPFLYGLAMDEGLIHSASLLSDVPLKLAGYAPKNFMRDYRGAVSVAEALQLSLNVPAVDMLQRITPARFDARLQHGGIALQYPDQETANLSMILGGAGSRLEDLVRGFSALARKGVSIKPRFIANEPVQERHMLSEEASWIISDVLKAVQAPPGFSAKESGIAWKTGTSYGFRDAWAIGYNERYTVGVWTGRPDGTPLPGEFGARAAGPLLFEVFQALPRTQKVNLKPTTVSQQRICWPLGRAVKQTRSEDCQAERVAWVINGAIPPTLKSLRESSWSAGIREFWVNATSGLRVTMACDVTDRQRRAQAHWPFELRPWLSSGQLQKMRLPDFDPACPPQVRHQLVQGLAIKGFDNSSRLLLQERDGQQSVAVDLQAEGGSGEYLWLINDEPVAWSYARQTIPYSFVRSGEYELTVLDSSANADKVTIRVVQLH